MFENCYNGNNLSRPVADCGVSYICQNPFLLLFRPGMLQCGLCPPKGGPRSPANMFLMFLVRTRTKN